MVGAVVVVAVVVVLVINLRASVIILSDIQILLLYGISVTGDNLLSLLHDRTMRKPAAC